MLFVCNHTAYSDPLVLSVMTGRSITYLIARNIYDHPFLLWMFRTFHCIPVDKDILDATAVRTLLRAIKRGRLFVFSLKGGIDEFPNEDGHLGVGYLALRPEAPVELFAIRYF